MYAIRSYYDEYKAKGEVSSTMLEIAAFDDLVGIVIYTLVSYNFV